jgi:hypothetical protein
LENFFDGNLCAWGILKDRNGVVQRKFVADIVASQQDNQLILDETFLFDDGEKQYRKWSFVQDSAQTNRWIGTAGDVVGEASGEVIGDSMRLTYELAINRDGDTINIAMDDWLYLIDQDTMIGSTDMSKWGFNVGQIQITIRKQQQLCINPING